MFGRLEFPFKNTSVEKKISWALYLLKKRFWTCLDPDCLPSPFAALRLSVVLYSPLKKESY